MVYFNEWQPKGGWVKYRKHQKRIEKLKAWLAVLLLLGVYILVGCLEST